MKKLIDVGLGRARFWRDEATAARYGAEQILRRHVSSSRRAGVTASAFVAIEVWLPMGPRALYGLLGVRYEVGQPDCEIRVPVITGSEGPRLDDTIAAACEQVRVGLPDEYGGAVVDALAGEAAALGLQGRISVEDAAHGLVGSSRSVFAALSRLAVRLVVERLDEREPVTLQETLREALTSSVENGRREPKAR
ncbi:MAG: hypothetical protein JWP97_648 [Labilithrix sp.]|nr:hypothetical protein [Labilithrix sp.]